MKVPDLGHFLDLESHTHIQIIFLVKPHDNHVGRQDPRYTFHTLLYDDQCHATVLANQGLT